METKSERDKNMKALFEIRNVDVTSRQDTIVITFYLTLFFVSEVIANPKQKITSTCEPVKCLLLLTLRFGLTKLKKSKSIENRELILMLTDKLNSDVNHIICLCLGSGG